MDGILVPTLLRFIVPFSIFKFPLAGFLASTIMDSIDWFIFPFTGPESYEFYQKWDKLFDLFFMGIATYVSFRNKEAIRRVLLALFLFRSIGVIMLELTGNRFYLLLFPNAFLGFYFFYQFYKHFSKLGKEVLLTTRERVEALIVTLIPTVVNEFFIHYLKKLPWEFPWGQFVHSETYPQTALFFNQVIWLLIYLSIPATYMFWKLRREKKTKTIATLT